MRHRADLDFVLDLLDEFNGLLPRRAAGAVGHGNVARMERAEFFDGLIEVLETGFVFRGEEFETHRGFALAQEIVDAHRREYKQSADRCVHTRAADAISDDQLLGRVVARPGCTLTPSTFATERSRPSLGAFMISILCERGLRMASTLLPPPSRLTACS